MVPVGVERAALRVEGFRAEDRAAWDDLVRRSHNGTFLHMRRYLDYHGDRFRDMSVVVRNEKGALLGVMPIAVDPSDSLRVVSHPGLTYGGVVHAGGIRGNQLVQVLGDTAERFSCLGFRALRYKAVPPMYHLSPVADDSWAMFRLGAVRYRCDLAATVDLEASLAVRRNRVRNLAAAREAGLVVVSGSEWLPQFWDILRANLRRKFAIEPVHSLEELQDLFRRFPSDITCDAVLDGSEVVAGLVNYHTRRTLHCQYSAASPRGLDLHALELGFAHAIDEARARGNRYFDFGVCNEEDGRVLNESLYDFKLSFGAGSTVHEFFEMTL